MNEQAAQATLKALDDLAEWLHGYEDDWGSGDDADLRKQFARFYGAINLSKNAITATLEG